MVNIGAGELVFILIAALLVLGPQRLPEFARAIGKFVREFRRQTDDVRMTVEREFYKMDQEFQDEPRPPVPMGIPSSHAPMPVPALASLPAPQEMPTVLEPSTPVAEALAVSVSSDTPAEDSSKSS